jgi:hypothetical protein
MNNAITIKDDTIIVNLIYFIHRDYSVTGYELLDDIFSKVYKQGMKVVFRAGDGENVEYSGFTNFAIKLSMKYEISHDLITFETHGRPITWFNHRRLNLGIFCSTGRSIPPFDKDVSNAKFIGTTLGRYTATRFRLAYEMDKAFPNDNYTVFQVDKNHVNRQLALCADLYQDELNWLSNKVFDVDYTSTHPIGMVEWQYSCANYGNIWNNFHIEIISETDIESNYWFTEKTARCLSTGKPFVIIAGQGSLIKLRELGFHTFNEVIDESYDMATSPSQRIKASLDSLKTLYFDENRAEKLQKMNEIAQKNIEIYNHYSSTVKEET